MRERRYQVLYHSGIDQYVGDKGFGVHVADVDRAQPWPLGHFQGDRYEVHRMPSWALQVWPTLGGGLPGTQPSCIRTVYDVREHTFASWTDPALWRVARHAAWAFCERCQRLRDGGADVDYPTQVLDLPDAERPQLARALVSLESALRGPGEVHDDVRRATADILGELLMLIERS